MKLINNEIIINENWIKSRTIVSGIWILFNDFNLCRNIKTFNFIDEFRRFQDTYMEIS